MRIGIDIDDTITYTYCDIIKKVSKYYKIKFDDLYSNVDYNYLSNHLSNYKQFCFENFENIIINVKLRENVKEVLNKLIENNEIYFITARNKEEYKNPYKTTYDYLKKNNIPFTKLFVEIKDKGKFCYENKIDLFIDDSIDNCKQAIKYNIKTIIIDNVYNKQEKKIKRMFNWNEIYKYIKEINMDERIITNHELEEDTFEQSIRPDSIDEYIGQTEVKENLNIFIKAAKIRDEPLDHVLLYGPPGLGKTTLSYIIANEMGTSIKTASGPSIEKAGDLAAILSTLEPGDVLFIDEIHRMPKYIEEILYPAMEDFKLDIIVGSDSTSRNIRIDLPPFTLVGATTRAGDITGPLRDRFGIVSKLQFYNEEELTKIVKRTSRVLNVKIDDDAAIELARRSRGTPRIANRLFKRVRDYALVMGNGIIDLEITKLALDKLKVDKLGLDQTDYNLLKSIIEKFNGGPVGIESLAASIGEEQTTIEDVYEPYLLQTGLLKRTNRGRIVTEKAYEHLGINPTNN